MARIIATGEGEELHVAIHRDEIAKIMGETYAISLTRENKSALNVGAEIPISEMYRRLDRLSTLDRTLAGVALELRKVADWLDTVPQIIEPPEPKSRKKETSNG